MKNKVLQITDGSVDMNNMSKEELEALRERTEEVHLNFTNLIDEVDISAGKNDYRVLLILGDAELIYQDGSFYIGETLNQENRKKITRKKAQEIFVNYYLEHKIKIKTEDKDKKESKVKEKSISRTRKPKVKEDDELER